METESQVPVRLHEIAQIAFSVRELNEAKAFYSDTLELKFLFDAAAMSFFQCGSIRLMISQVENASISDGTIVYFRVPDLEATARTLRERGVRFVREPHLVARMKSHDLWMAFLKDPSGNTLGLMSEIGRAKE